MIFTACMETLQSLSNFVILQCILNPVFLCGLLSRSTIRRAASAAAPASITCPLCPMMISAPQEPVGAAPRTAAALMRSAKSRVRPRPRRSPIFVRPLSAQSRAGTYDPDRTDGLPSSRHDRKHVRVGRRGCCGKIIDDLQRAQSKARCRSRVENNQPRPVSAILSRDSGHATARAPSNPDRNAGARPLR